MAETSELLSVAEAATLAGVSERTMRRWAASGQVRTVGRGHVRRMPSSELAAIGGQAGRSAAATRTSAAGMWQTHAEGLGMQLDQARSELRALQAPSLQGGQEEDSASNLSAEASDPYFGKQQHRLHRHRCRPLRRHRSGRVPTAPAGGDGSRRGCWPDGQPVVVVVVAVVDGDGRACRLGPRRPAILRSEGSCKARPALARPKWKRMKP